MWTIRQEQVETFRQHHLQKFEDEMVIHLKKFAPKHWEIMGEAAGRHVIRLGIEQAGKYGFTDRGPVRFYIELMLMFGSYFDTDPQYPWATAVLKNTEAMDQALRADQLFAAMNTYLAEIVEPERKHLHQALQLLTEARIEDYLTLGTNREEAILQGLQSACPLRAQYLGEPVLRRLIRHGVELARSFGFTTDKGIALMFVLTFLGGHGSYKDPQYAWIARGLDSNRCPDAGKRLEDLSSKSVLYLEQILAGSSKE